MHALGTGPPIEQADTIGLIELDRTHAACQPPTATLKHASTHTHSGLVPAPAICVCLYVGLLYQGMCYINV